MYLGHCFVFVRYTREIISYIYACIDALLTAAPDSSPESSWSYLIVDQSSYQQTCRFFTKLNGSYLVLVCGGEGH